MHHHGVASRPLPTGAKRVLKTILKLSCPDMPPVCRNYRVAVLLSAYGDSVFFEKQIDSLKRSLTINDILIVVDDGSGQVNWDAVSEWPFHYLFWSRIQGLGSARSFWELSVDLPVSA